MYIISSPYGKKGKKKVRTLEGQMADSISEL